MRGKNNERNTKKAYIFRGNKATKEEERLSPSLLFSATKIVNAQFSETRKLWV